MPQPTEADIDNAIRKYCARYNVTLKEELSDWYDTRTQWNDYIPNAMERGCYFIYDDTKALRYIGKVSLSHTLGSRVASYFKKVSRDGAEPVHEGWTCIPTYVRTLAVENAWEAPSLEEYLIVHLQPAQNTRGLYPAD